TAELIVEDEQLVLVIFGVRHAVLRHDEEWTEHATPDLLRRVVMGVVHVTAERLCDEVVDECLPRFDGRLRDEGNAVHLVHDALAVPMDARGLVGLIRDLDPDALAFGHPDDGARNLAVVRERVDDDAGRDLPADLVAAELELASTVDDA